MDDFSTSGDQESLWDVNSQASHLEAGSKVDDDDQNWPDDRSEISALSHAFSHVGTDDVCSLFPILKMF